MIEDVATAQARAFLAELLAHAEKISTKLAAAEERQQRARLRGIKRRDPSPGILRSELNEARRLIEGLHQRFPEVAKDY